MNQSSSVEVSGPRGLRGTIDTSAWPLDGSRQEIEILLNDGRRVMVATDLLERIDDRHYRLATAAADLIARVPTDAGSTPEAAVVVPVIQEQMSIGKRTVESGRVRLRKVLRQEEETINQPLAREEVTVERVTIGRTVDGPQPSRRDGEDWIIPVVEEVLVVEKRFVLKEELRVRKRIIQERHHETVTLQREEVIVERLPAQGSPPTDASTNEARPPGSTDSSAPAAQQNGTTIAPDRSTRA
jgi:uncharacterized protein (TIGR02271 family)